MSVFSKKFLPCQPCIVLFTRHRAIALPLSTISEITRPALLSATKFRLPHPTDLFTLLFESLKALGRFLCACKADGSIGPLVLRKTSTSNSDIVRREKINESPMTRPFAAAKVLHPPENLTSDLEERGGALKLILRFTRHVEDPDRRRTSGRSLSPCSLTNHVGNAWGRNKEISQKHHSFVSICWLDIEEHTITQCLEPFAALEAATVFSK